MGRTGEGAQSRPAFRAGAPRRVQGASQAGHIFPLAPDAFGVRSADGPPAFEEEWAGEVGGRRPEKKSATHGLSASVSTTFVLILSRIVSNRGVF